MSPTTAKSSLLATLLLLLPPLHVAAASECPANTTLTLGVVVGSGSLPLVSGALGDESVSVSEETQRLILHLARGDEPEAAEVAAEVAEETVMTRLSSPLAKATERVETLGS